jgi:hypothetical protein
MKKALEHDISSITVLSLFDVTKLDPVTLEEFNHPVIALRKDGTLSDFGGIALPSHDDFHTLVNHAPQYLNYIEVSGSFPISFL